MSAINLKRTGDSRIDEVIANLQDEMNKLVSNMSRVEEVNGSPAFVFTHNGKRYYMTGTEIVENRRR